LVNGRLAFSGVSCGFLRYGYWRLPDGMTDKAQKNPAGKRRS